MTVATSLFARIRRGAGTPEESVAMRVVVAGAVEVAILAVVAQGGVTGTAAILPLVLAPVGYAFSYRQRHHSNLTTKVLLSVGLLAAFAAFLQSVQLAGSVDQARVPLASLFLWVQVLHAFDVPRRRDLAFSMVSSVILIAEAGALSLSSSFVLFVIPWAVLSGGWLFLSSRPRSDVTTQPISVRRRPTVAVERRHLSGGRCGWERPSCSRPCSSSWAIPRLPGTLIRSLPFSLGGAASAVSNFAGGVENPSLPAAAGDGVVNFAADAYPGFSDVVDLRARGHLSDQIAFRVRAPQAALWRAEAFDTYDGTTWTDLGSVDRAAAGQRRTERRHRATRSRGTYRTGADRSRHPDVLHRDAAAERVVRRGHPGAGVLPESAGLEVGALRLRPFARSSWTKEWCIPWFPTCR